MKNIYVIIRPEDEHRGILGAVESPEEARKFINFFDHPDELIDIPVPFGTAEELE